MLSQTRLLMDSTKLSLHGKGGLKIDSAPSTEISDNEIERHLGDSSEGQSTATLACCDPQG